MRRDALEITESRAHSDPTVSAKPNLICSLRSAPRLKKVINWLDSENLYLDYDGIGKRKLGLHRLITITIELECDVGKSTHNSVLQTGLSPLRRDES
jgi:hypothetical protein